MSAALSGVTLNLMGVGHVFQIPVCSKSPCATLVWYLKLQSLVILSLIESEYVVLSETARELMWYV